MQWVRWEHLVIAISLVGCGSASGGALFSGHKDTSKIDTTVDSGAHFDAGGSASGSGGAASQGGGVGRDAGAGAASGGKTGGIGGTATTAGGMPGASGGVRPDAGGGTGRIPDAGSGGVPPASSEAGAPDGDSGSKIGATPHSVVCGTAACDVSATRLPIQTCCVGALQQTGLCVPLTPQGCGRAGTLLTCDDAADCQSGQICCLDVTGNGVAGFCSLACQTTMQQLCREDAECPGGLSCLPLDLRPEYSACR